MPAAVVAHGRADALRDRSQVACEQMLQALALQVGRGFQRLVQVSDVRGVMLAVMNLHRGLVDVWLQRISGVGERWKFKCHVFSFVHDR